MRGELCPLLLRRDLEPLWDGNEEAYTDNSGVQASEAGARVIADAIWDVMQDNCIAQ